jgi:Domain of unknown function (DUF4760)
VPNPTAAVNLPLDVISRLAEHDPSPNWAERWTTIGTLALVVTAIMAGVFTYFGIRQARGIQHAQTFLEISRRWNEEKFRQGRIRIRNFYDVNKSPEDVTAKLLALKADNEEQYWQALATLEFFEIVAMNIRYNAITFEMVYELMGSTVCLYWKMLSDHIKKRKESEPDSQNFYIEFETLAARIKEIKRIAETEENKYLKRWKIRRARRRRAL